MITFFFFYLFYFIFDFTFLHELTPDNGGGGGRGGLGGGGGGGGRRRRSLETAEGETFRASFFLSGAERRGKVIRGDYRRQVDRRAQEKGVKSKAANWISGGEEEGEAKEPVAGGGGIKRNPPTVSCARHTHAHAGPFKAFTTCAVCPAPLAAAPRAFEWRLECAPYPTPPHSTSPPHPRLPSLPPTTLALSGSAIKDGRAQ